jgi:hypothetical protein
MSGLLSTLRIPRSNAAAIAAYLPYLMYIKIAGEMKTQPFDRLGIEGKQNLMSLTQ